MKKTHGSKGDLEFASTYLLQSGARIHGTLVLFLVKKSAA